MANTVAYRVQNGSEAVIQFEVQEKARPGERLVGRELEAGAPPAVQPRIEEALASVKAFGAKILEAASELAPAEASVEFGVIFKGETNAIIAKSSAEGHVKIILKWEKPKARDVLSTELAPIDKSAEKGIR